MACDCEYKRIMADLERVRGLAKKSAILTGADQIIYKKSDGTFCFVPEGESYGGEFVEYVLTI